MRLVVASIASIVSGSAIAQSPVKFQVNQALYESVSTTVSQDGVDDAKSVEHVTTPQSLELVVGVDDWSVHVWPTAGGSDVAVGYGVADGLEVGLSLGHSESIDDTSSDVLTNYGVFGVYALDVNTVIVEFGLALGMSQGKARTDAGKVETSATDVGLGVGVIVPVKGALSYLGTVGYGMNTQKVKDADGDIKSNALTVSPLGLRLDL